MTIDLPPAADPSGRPAGRTGPRAKNRTDSAETERVAGSVKTPPANKVGRHEELVLRSDSPPVDQLDFDDRHDTRATQSTAMLSRYGTLRSHRRKDDRHRLAMSLVTLVVGVTCYLTGFVAVSRLLPHLTHWQAAQIVMLAFLATGSGIAARSAGRALKRRYDRRPTSNST